MLAKLVDEFKKSLNHRRLMHRNLTALRFFSKKDQIRKLQSQLRESAWNLLTALMISSNSLQCVSMLESSQAKNTKVVLMSIKSKSLVPALHSVQPIADPHYPSLFWTRTTSLILMNW